MTYKKNEKQAKIIDLEKYNLIIFESCLTGKPVIAFREGPKKLWSCLYSSERSELLSARKLSRSINTYLIKSSKIIYKK